LSTGARQVLATNWSIWDTPFTAAFDQAVVARLRRSDDPAATLRLSQLEALQAWRQSPHDFSDYTGGGLNFEEFSTPFPLIWAAYSCVGLRH
jgi:CHAT domain-containing protein